MIPPRAEPSPRVSHAVEGERPCPDLGRVVALRGGALGDLLVTFPALLALRARSEELWLCCPRRFGALALQAGLCDRVLDIMGVETLWLHSLGSEAGPRVPDWREVELAVSWVRDTERALLGAGVKRVLTGSIDGPERPVHRQLLSALAPLGLQGAPTGIRLAWPSSDHTPSVIIAPGSGGVRKRWPLHAWLQTTERLLHQGLAVRWVAGPDEIEELDAWRELLLRAGLPEEVEVVFEGDLARTASLAAGALAWAGVDSGTSHLAALVGCPSVVLFGPTDPVFWAPPGALVLRLEDPPERVARAILGMARSGA